MLSSLAHMQAQICRVFMQKYALRAWCSRRVFTTMLTRRSHDVHPAFRRAGTPELRAELASHFLFQPIASRALRPQHAPALRGVVPLVTSRDGRPDPLEVLETSDEDNQDVCRK